VLQKTKCNTRWFYHSFLYNYFILIVLLLKDSSMMATEMTKTLVKNNNM